MAAAVLPLLTAGTPPSTTDAANAATQNNGQNSTTLNASVSAGLTQDKTYAGDVTKMAEPASLGIWKGDAGKVHYTVKRHQTRRPARGGQPQRPGHGHLHRQVGSNYRPDGEGVHGAEGNRKPVGTWWEAFTS